MTELSTTRALKPHVTIVEAAVQIPTSLVVVGKRHESSEAPEKYGRCTHGGTLSLGGAGPTREGKINQRGRSYARSKNPKGQPLEGGSSRSGVMPCAAVVPGALSVAY